MKTLKVVAAIIERDKGGNSEIFATQRGYGDYKDSWEFPGGKVEPGESPEDALAREIKEELDIKIAIDAFLCTVEYDYPKFHLSMDCFICHIEKGDPVLLEHEAAIWLDRDNLYTVEWLPSDIEVIEKYKKWQTGGYHEQDISHIF